jgi:UDP-glucose 4-epimerase
MITGGAGFIGSNLSRALLRKGCRVLLVDDLSRGSLSLVKDVLEHPDAMFVQADCADEAALLAAAETGGGEISDVWHMAANSDIPAGVADASIDIHRTFMTTVGVLAVMKTLAIPTLHFASSSAIYGDFGDEVIHEDIGPLQPISNYGAMKLASEAQISAAVEAYLPRAEVFRFPNVIGTPATHGVVFDFIQRLRDRPDRLEVLGNGSQQKSYLHVSDLIGAMFHIGSLEGRRLVYNIGPSDDGITVRFIAEAVRDRVSPGAAIAFGESDRGWVGDVPRFRYSVDRLKATGWSPTRSSAEAMVLAVDEIARQNFALPSI